MPHVGPQPRVFLSVAKKIRRNIWPWKEGVRSRLPDHYKLRYMQFQNEQQTPVYWRPNLDRFEMRGGKKVPVQNIPIPVIYPKDCDKGLWGGEGILQGLRKWRNNKRSPRVPKIWKPCLLNRVFYSEILDRWMTITVTPRTLDLIDDAYGFDFYILKTSQADLKSQLGMDLKREMILALIRRKMFPDDPVKQEKIYNRYKEFIIPEEEAEWLGLSIKQAEIKQQNIEKRNLEASIRPLKDIYTLDLLSKLTVSPEEFEEKEKDGWLSKLNPFTEKSEEKTKS